MGIDKYKAIKHKWRIREKTLFLLSLFGGSLGGFAGMFLFRHKTKKFLFYIIYTIAFTLHCTAIYFALTF